LLEHALFRIKHGAAIFALLPERTGTQECGGNKQKGRGLSRRPAILSPLPRAWLVISGRSRRTDRLRPNLFAGRFWWRTFPCGASFFGARHFELAASAHVIRPDARSDQMRNPTRCGRLEIRATV